MFSSDKNVEAIRQLCADFKDYLELKGRSVQLSLAEKLSIAASALLLGALLLVLGGAGILYLSATLTLLLANVVGAAAACGIIAALHVLVCLLLYWNRSAWIVNPVTRFVAGLVMGEEEEKNDSQRL